jgi:hypothetical protein
MRTTPSFEELVVRYHKTLSKIAATFEADAKLQQDLLQEILLSLWQALEQFKGDSSLHTYVYYMMFILVMMSGISIVWYQRGIWKTYAKHSTHYIELMLKQNRAASKVAKVGEMSGYGVVLIFYGIVFWGFFPSMLAGTLATDLSSIAKPVMGSMILLFVTVTGLADIIFHRKLQRSLAKKADTLQMLIKDFQ